MYKVRLEKFEGPLDLLLQLIEGQKLDITEVSLAQVADQYLEYLNQAQELNIDELADFLVIAAKLLYIKSKALLPSLDLGDDDLKDLEKQLKIYKEYLDASKVINRMILAKRFSFVRERAIKSEEIIFNPPKNLALSKLKNIFEEILNDLKPIFELPRRTLEKTISIQEKIQYIKNLILSCIQNKSCFGAILKNVKSKTEIIVSFLALLELVKQRTIAVNQEELFKEITIEKI
jgi:segregation and condensation protein A